VKYRLRVTKRKSGKYLYEVLDNEDNIISKRESERKYVACTIDGIEYFGRLDLIAKSKHALKTPIAFVRVGEWNEIED